jgi:hypothetical protein
MSGRTAGLSGCSRRRGAAAEITRNVCPLLFGDAVDQRR